jgi:hypothetical protein
MLIACVFLKTGTMKKGLLIGLLFIQTIAFGQMEKNFSSNDSADIPKLVKLIITNAKNTYKLKNINHSHENAIEVVYASGKNNLVIEFAGNKTNDGVTVYTFVSVTGLFEDVFRFWKRYYQHNAKGNAVLKAGHGKVTKTALAGGAMITSFVKYGDKWEIENRFSGKK